MPYVTIGYPSIEATLEVVPVLANCGSDIVELGIPFSDPLADGVTIQQASYQSLQNGTTPRMCLEVARELRQKVDIPLLFMTYFNLVFHYGIREFCRACAESDINGLIIPDLLPEEGSETEAVTQKHGLDLIYFLAPTSNEKRIRLVADRARGFIYLVSVTGVTGARDTLPPDLELFINRVKKVATQPLCVGFGISNPEQAKQVARIADGVIIGSKLIQLMDTGGNYLPTVSNFISGLRRALDEISSEEDVSG